MDAREAALLPSGKGDTLAATHDLAAREGSD
jgi:hypothetical protein